MDADAGELMQLQNVIVTLLTQQYHTRLCNLAVTTIVLYDYVITFRQEVSLMWNSHWSLGKALFFTIRYYTIVMILINMAVIVTDNLPLRTWVYWHWVSAIASTIMSEMVLVLRIYVMFRKNKKILTFLLISFSIMFLVSVGIAAKLLTMAIITIYPIPGVPFHFCATTNLPSWFYVFWIPAMVFETILFALALVKGYTTVQFNFATGPASSQSLLDCLIQDSILYFTVIFIAYLTNLIVWIVGGLGLVEVAIGFALSLASILSQRMFLNMKISARRTSGLDDISELSNSDHPVAQPPRPRPIPATFRPSRNFKSFDSDIGGTISPAFAGGSVEPSSSPGATGSESAHSTDIEKEVRMSTSVEAPLTKLTYHGNTSAVAARKDEEMD